MTGMFYSCVNLPSLDLSSFITTNVTSMIGTFKDCYLLKTINFGSSFDTSHVTSFKELFSGCASLTSLDLSSWDTRNVEDMGWMFSVSYMHYSGIENWNVEKVKNMKCMFSRYMPHNGQEDVYIDLSNWKTKSLREVRGNTSLENSLIGNHSVYFINQNANEQSIHLSNKGTTIAVYGFSYYSTYKGINMAFKPIFSAAANIDATDINFCFS